jgi:hypothetical protein
VNLRLVQVALATLLLAGSCARTQPPPGADLIADVPPSTITAITLKKTSCYGTCPAFVVRFTAGDDATYVGQRYAPRLGRYAGKFRFAPLAAFVDAQHPEAFAPTYATNWVDTPYVTLTIERGSRVQTVTTGMLSATPFRFQGIVLALDGAAGRVRWKPVVGK